MKNERHIVSYSAEELRAKRRRSKSLTELERLQSISDLELEAAVASDPDEAGMVVDWSSARVVVPGPKETMTIRLDRDVLEFFKKSGRGYQTRINAVLRSFMDHELKQPRKSKFPRGSC